MRHLQLLLLALAVPLALTACRVGGGFDSEGRLRSRPVQTTTDAKNPDNKTNTNPDTANKTDSAALSAPVVYLTPAG